MDFSKYTFSSPLTHSDWMMHPNVEWGDNGVKMMLDKCKKMGWKRLYWRVFDAGRATYKSKILTPAEHWEFDNYFNPQTQEDCELLQQFASDLTPSQRLDILKKANSLDYTHFDSLKSAVDYGHSIGLKIYAWLTINEDDHAWGMPSRFSKIHPEFRWRRRNGKPFRSQLSFAFPEVRKYKLDLVKEILNYKIDGLFLDWVRTGDIRDNPQNDPDGNADYGYEEPLVEGYKQLHGINPVELPPDEPSWLDFRCQPQTLFMRDVKTLVEANGKNMPIAVLVAHPWLYRGFHNPIAGNKKGLLLDVAQWAKEGLIHSASAAGYYLNNATPEQATRALLEETGNAVDIILYCWTPKTTEELMQNIAIAEKVGAHQLLFWEADYIEVGDRTELMNFISQSQQS